MENRASKTMDEPVRFPVVSPENAAEYEKAGHLLVDRVNTLMTARGDLTDLIGEGNLALMYNNHENHAAFMSGVFSLGEYGLLDATIPWVYRAYKSHGFSYDYFPVAMNLWIDSVSEYLSQRAAAEISAVYRSIISRHQEFISASLKPLQPDWAPYGVDGAVQASFLDGLLQGNTRKCIDIARQYSAGDRTGFYLKVVQPSMYQVGHLWESGKISIAQEHLASAVVNRVLTSLFVDDDDTEAEVKGKVVVTAACNEYHQIGASMVADLLERDGWRVYYLGANTPVADVVGIVRTEKAQLCAVSVAMPYNLTEVKELISLVKDSKDLSNVRVMVGGHAFISDPELWRRLGADGYAHNAAGAVELAARWWDESTHDK